MITTGQRIQLGTYEYRIVKPLGTGYLAQVYEAERFPERTPLAIKFLKEEHETNLRAQAQFQEETEVLRLMAQAEAAYGTHYAVRLYDSGQDREGRHYQVQELARGRPVVYWIDLKEEDRLDIAAQFAHLLEITHSIGVALPDMKADEIFYDGKAVQVVDWNLTRGGISERQKDIFRIGCVMYQLFTEHELRVDTESGQIEGEVGFGIPLWQALSYGTRAIIARTVHREESRRYPTAQELRQELLWHKENLTLEAAKDADRLEARASEARWKELWSRTIAACELARPLVKDVEALRRLEQLDQLARLELEKEVLRPLARGRAKMGARLYRGRETGREDDRGAIEEFESVLRLDPSNRAARYLLLQSWIGLHLDTRQDLDGELKPKAWQAVDRAVQSLISGDYEVAEEWLRTASQVLPDEARLRELAGTVKAGYLVREAEEALRQRNFDQALERLKYAQTQAPEEVWIRGLQAQVEAERRRQRSIQEWLDRAEREFTDERYAAAEECYNEVLKLEPSHVEARRKRDLAREMNRVDDLFRRGKRACREADLTRAEELLYEALHIHPEYGLVKLWYEAVQHFLREPEGDEIIVSEPCRRRLVTQAATLFAQRRYAEAEQRLKEAFGLLGECLEEISTAPVAQLAEDVTVSPSLVSPGEAASGRQPATQPPVYGGANVPLMQPQSDAMPTSPATAHPPTTKASAELESEPQEADETPPSHLPVSPSEHEAMLALYKQIRAAIHQDEHERTILEERLNDIEAHLDVQAGRLTNLPPVLQEQGAVLLDIREKSTIIGGELTEETLADPRWADLRRRRNDLYTQCSKMVSQAQELKRDWDVRSKKALDADERLRLARQKLDKAETALSHEEDPEPFIEEALDVLSPGECPTTVKEQIARIRTIWQDRQEKVRLAQILGSGDMREARRKLAEMRVTTANEERCKHITDLLARCECADSLDSQVYMAERELWEEKYSAAISRLQDVLNKEVVTTDWPALGEWLKTVQERARRLRDQAQAQLHALELVCAAAELPATEALCRVAEAVRADRRWQPLLQPLQTLAAVQERLTRQENSPLKAPDVAQLALEGQPRFPALDKLEATQLISIRPELFEDLGIVAGLSFENPGLPTSGHSVVGKLQAQLQSTAEKLNELRLAVDDALLKLIDRKIKQHAYEDTLGLLKMVQGLPNLPPEHTRRLQELQPIVAAWVEDYKTARQDTQKGHAAAAEGRVEEALKYYQSARSQMHRDDNSLNEILQQCQNLVYVQRSLPSADALAALPGNQVSEAEKAVLAAQEVLGELPVETIDEHLRLCRTQLADKVDDARGRLIHGLIKRAETIVEQAQAEYGTAVNLCERARALHPDMPSQKRVDRVYRVAIDRMELPKLREGAIDDLLNLRPSEARTKLTEYLYKQRTGIKRLLYLDIQPGDTSRTIIAEEYGV